MAHRKQVSMRRWKARVRLGKWIPMQVVFALDKSQELFSNWDQHPTDPTFMRLRRSAEVTS